MSREFNRLSGIRITKFNEGVQKYAQRIAQIQIGSGTKKKMPDAIETLKKRAQESETETARNG